MKINCLVVDDEPAGRKMIEQYVSEIGYLHLSASVSNPEKAMAILDTQEIHLMFLDVQMPKLNGIEFLKKLPHAPLVIMITAYSEYALQGFDLEVVDYVLKPVSGERFLKAVSKAKELHELRRLPGNRPEQESSHFFIKSNNQYEKIKLDELLFIEAANNYVVLQTREKKITTYLTFKAVSDYLPKDRFIKVHKSFMVSLGQIDSMDTEKIRILSYEIPISRKLRSFVLEHVISKNVIKRES